MTTLTLHAVRDLTLIADYLPAPVDALHLRTSDDPGHGPAHATPEGHVVRLDAAGRPTLVEFHAAAALLAQGAELVATLPDGRRLELDRRQLAELIASRG